MTLLPKSVQYYFDSWINLDTWATGHPLDDERFYRFVKAYSSCTRKYRSPKDIENLIIKKWEGKFEKEYLLQAAHKFAQKFDLLRDYDGDERRRAEVKAYRKWREANEAKDR